MGTIRLNMGDFGTYLVTDEETGKDLLIQSDWDFPGLAWAFGWCVSDVHDDAHDDNPIGCRHHNTDGTINCPDCGMPAGDFIASARDYLDEHDGDTAEDPGYFPEE